MPRERPSESAPRRLQLDLALAAAPHFGLGVPTRAGLRGGGGELRLDLRGARRWLVSVGLRASGDVTAGAGPGAYEGPFGLARIRVSLGGGAWFRHRRFDLRAIASVSAEPWLVTRRGRRVGFGAAAGPAPLLGGHLKLLFAPALSARLHLGIFTELAVSAAPSGRAVEVRLEGARLFAFGGLEAAIGVELRGCLCPGRPG